MVKQLLGFQTEITKRNIKIHKPLIDITWKTDRLKANKIVILKTCRAAKWNKYNSFTGPLLLANKLTCIHYADIEV